jgi:hypothetical protein
VLLWDASKFVKSWCAGSGREWAVTGAVQGEVWMDVQERLCAIPAGTAR